MGGLVPERLFSTTPLDLPFVVSLGLPIGAEPQAHISDSARIQRRAYSARHHRRAFLHSSRRPGRVGGRPGLPGRSVRSGVFRVLGLARASRQLIAMRPCPNPKIMWNITCPFKAASIMAHVWRQRITSIPMSRRSVGIREFAHVQFAEFLQLVSEVGSRGPCGSRAGEKTTSSRHESSLRGCWPRAGVARTVSLNGRISTKLGATRSREIRKWRFAVGQATSGPSTSVSSPKYWSTEH